MQGAVNHLVRRRMSIEFEVEVEKHGGEKGRLGASPEHEERQKSREGFV